MIGLSKVFEGFGGKFGERWLETLFTPAFLFWAGGCVLWASTPNFMWQALKKLENFVKGLDGTHQVLLAVGAFLVIAATSTVAERFTLPLLRLFEGYWPRWAHRLTRRLSARWTQRRASLERKWMRLARRAGAGTLSPARLSLYVELDRRLHEIPVDAAYHMPTRIGNVLRAAERTPYDKYGLDGIVCWPRLWLVMPDSAKGDVADARTQLNASTRLTFWSIVFVAWSGFSWIALPLAAIGVWYGYRSMLDDARAYGDLVESAYDVERRALYKSVGWAYPANASLEKASGIRLTSYLWRGSDDAAVVFAADDGH